MKVKSGRNILIIEHSPVDGYKIQTFLEEQQFSVRLVQTSREALYEIEKSPPDLVILNAQLPDNHGYGICGQIKSIGESKGMFLPVILLTTKDRVRDIVEGLDSGADDYVVKSLVLDELLARVRSLIRIQSLQYELQRTNRKLSEIHARMQRELDIVECIQRSFLPSDFPHHPELTVGARYIPSMKAGGDYHDVVPVDDRHWGVVMADISGHGASAAVIMALTQMTVKEFAKGILHPAEALTRFNEILERHVHTDHYITMLYGVLNLDTLDMTYASAGHHPMLHYSARTGEIAQINTDRGFPLLTFDNNEFDERTETIRPGDRILFYTDGVLDLKNDAGEFLGLERLEELMKKHLDKNAGELVGNVLDDAKDFYRGEAYLDDISMLAIARNP